VRVNEVVYVPASAFAGTVTCRGRETAIVPVPVPVLAAAL
jgi:hypothetical protein